MKRARIYSIILLLLIALSGLNMVSAQSGGVDVTIRARANIRSGPGTSFGVVSVATAGTVMRVDGHNFDSTWIRGITSGGAIGWIAANITDINQAQIGSLPQIANDAPITVSAPPQPANTVVTTTGSGAPSGASAGVTATARVNMRSGPGTSFRRVDGLSAGDPINIDGRDSSGAWVRGINRNGSVGWVYASYLTISPGDVANLPVVTNDTPFTLAAPGGGAPAVAGGGAPAAPPAVAVASNTPIRGFSYGGHVQSFSEFTANWMRVAGMTWIKRQWRYVDGQSANDVAGTINDAHARGFRILIGVVGLSPNDLNSPGYFDRYASFVAGVARLQADAIEIWNEPNLDREWPAPIDPGRYTELLRVSFNAIKAANPNTFVISGAPSPTGAEGAFPGRVMNDDRFIAGMAAAGAANYMDCVGVHYNEGIVAPNLTSGDPRDNYYTRYFRPMLDIYYNAFGGARPVCFTELGYLTPEGFGPLPSFFGWAQNVTVAQQAAWLDQVVGMARNNGHVRLLIIWNIDFTTYGDDPQGGYAIIRPGGGCPACQALGS